MDRPVEKAGWSRRRWIGVGIGLVVIVAVAWQLGIRTSGSRLKADADRVTTAVVSRGTFSEYYPFDGSIEPATSVYLDIDEGGRVEKIYAEGGAHVEKGDLILRFSNATLRQNALNTETQLLYNLDIQRTTVFNRQQSTLLLKDSLLDMDHQILDLENKFKRYDALMKAGDSAISVELYETTHNQLTYLKDKRALLAERIRQEDELSSIQLEQAKRSIGKLNDGLGLVSKLVESENVRAPISGYLSTIDAQVGQNITRGQRIGQIDLLDKFKIRAHIDQLYISRVVVDTPGHVTLDGKSWDVKVQKVYPEVKNSLFEADVVFSDAVPDSLKRGQTVTVELTFGAPSQTLIVSKGGYYQQTAGRWVYLVSRDGKSARRTDVKLGRQNPRQVEVLEGLAEGDRIITSGYDSYNNADELRFSEAIKTTQAIP